VKTTFVVTGGVVDWSQRLQRPLRKGAFEMRAGVVAANGEKVDGEGGFDFLVHAFGSSVGGCFFTTCARPGSLDSRLKL
jgi:hypothetical protein